MKALIEFLCEQDGEVERILKSRLNQVFLKHERKIRAYLVLARYVQQNTLNVMLCIKSESNNDENIIKECAQIFNEIFNQNQHLDIMIINEKEEMEIKKVCPSFYPNEIE